MECSKCGSINDSSNKFCRNCGNHLQAVFCKNCGMSLKADAHFCANCGTKVEQDTVQLEETNHSMKKSEMDTFNEKDSIGKDPKEFENNQVNQESQSPNEHQETPETVKYADDSSSEEQHQATEEDQNRQPSKMSKYRNWILAGAALFIAAISAFLIFSKGDTVPATKKLIASDQTEAAKNMKLSIESVSIDDYPLVKMTVSVQDAPENMELSKDKLSISENQKTHEVKEVNELKENIDSGSSDENPSLNKRFEVLYETTVVNSNPLNGEVRNIELLYLNSKAIGTYTSPQQYQLRVDNFSCNTDEYPNISCFFSLFDQNNNQVDNINFDPQYIKGAENQTPLESLSITKLSEEEQYTSTNLVIDISTSMNDYNRIGQVKNAVSSFLNSVTMSDKNLVGILSFADSEYIYQEPFTSDKATIADTVNSFETGGSCTALYEAINEAVYNTSYNDKNGSKYVIAFTDGKDNCSDYVSSQTLINNALQLGVPIYAVSVDHDPELQRIAEQTQGKYSNLGNDIAQLNYFYREIFEDKKNQYVLSYKSALPKKTPRNLQMALMSPALYTDTTTENVTPKLLNDYAVADVMQKYQIGWSEAMNIHDVSPIMPYVTQNRPETDNTSVYNIVYNQIFGSLTSSGNRSGGLINVNTMYGEELYYHIPDYTLVDAEKVSDEHYKLRIQKRVQRDATILVNKNDPSLGFYPTLTTFKETAYTYNVIKENGTWLVDSFEDEAVPICYKDATYTEKYQRSDGKSSKNNGNCPGITMGER